MIDREVSEHIFGLEICPSTIRLFYAPKITWPFKEINRANEQSTVYGGQPEIHG
jgi:hypothetical protein